MFGFNAMVPDLLSGCIGLYPPWPHVCEFSWEKVLLSARIIPIFCFKGGADVEAVYTKDEIRSKRKIMLSTFKNKKILYYKKNILVNEVVFLNDERYCIKICCP